MWRSRPCPWPILSYDRRLLVVPFVGVLGVVAVLTVLLWNEFFTGYATYDESAGWRGSLHAAALVLLSITLLHGGRRPGGWRLGSLLRSPYGLAYTGVLVLTLSLGSRISLATHALVLACLHSQRRPVRWRTVVLLGVSGLGLIGVVGLWRLGHTATLLPLLAGFLAEPLFVSLPLLDVLQTGPFPLLQAPWWLLSDLVNLVPTLLVPMKAQWLLGPEDLGFPPIVSPLGALHVGVSALWNFGIIGTIGMCVLLGWGMQALQMRMHGSISRTVYALLTGMLSFTLWRDPFSVSLVKSLLQFSILVPVGLGLLLHLVTHVAWVHGTSPSTSRTRHPARATRSRFRSA
jgi:hypothetical protein